MAKVHEFTLDNDLYPDTRVPFQYRGGGKSNTRRAFELSALVAFVQANLGFGSQVQTVSGSTYAYDIPAGVWLIAFAIEGSNTFTFNVGNTAGDDTIIYEGQRTADAPAQSFTTLLYGGDGGRTIYFSGLSGSNSITFLTLGIEI